MATEDGTRETNATHAPLDYEQDYELAKAMLETELQRLQALQELQSVIHDIRAWLNGESHDESHDESHESGKTSEEGA